MFFKAIFSMLVFMVFALAEPLSVKDAFNLTHHADDQNIEFRFALAPDIHVYKDSIGVSSGGQNLNKFLNFPKHEIDDNHEVYKDKFSIFVPISLLKDINGGENFTLTFSYQGCAKDGICYQPQTLNFSAKKGISAYSLTQILDEPGVTLSEPAPLSEQDSIASDLGNKNFILSLVTFFGYGLLLSLTPCIFPMIPILSSIIVSKQGQNLSSQNGKNPASNGLFLSLVYVLAMALAYAITGVFASFFGSGLQSALQTPSVLIGFSLVFVVLALSMFGLFELQMPLRLQNLLNKKAQSKGGVLGVFIMGFLSALIASPCVAAPLAGVLLYIAQSGNALFGGLALFTMGLGMGVPLLVIGASSGKLLPRPGVWMNKIKMLFGFIMLFMAVWLSARVLGARAELLLYGVIGVFASVFFGAFDVTAEGENGKKLLKGTAMVVFIYSVLLIAGSFLGAKSVFDPLGNLSGKGVNLAQKSEANFKLVSNLNELEHEIKNSSKPVMIDFYATWCISCNEFDEITFKDEAVLKRLANFTLLRVDVTKGNRDDAEILKKFGLIGPPAILFFNGNSNADNEQKNARIIGFYDPSKFLNHLDKFGF